MAVLPLVLAVCLAAGGARADTQQALTHAALDKLVRATEALERGDTGDALFYLVYMQNEVNNLSATAQQFRQSARTAEQQCQARSLQLISAIETNYARQRELERQDAQLEAEIRVQRDQAARDAATLTTTAQLAEIHRQETVFRARCKSDNAFYYEHFGQCFIRVWEDRFTTRAEQIQHEVDDLTRRSQALAAAINEAVKHQQALQDELAQHKGEESLLQAQRPVLEQQDRAVRLAITSLSDVTVFWDTALSLLTVNVANRLGLLRDLLPTLDVTSHAPVFDDYDRAEIRSLRATLLDFAKTVDNRNNFLSTPTICR
ncbi:hypothetical protein [Elioraea sp.]|uniref:hypothetical protein n=1 Tax=Elioraea sp. TaxID=2185103 RepID=UPI0025BF0B30|nr:hypothetical protein [Elioraea sp.]